ncbi:putative ABC transport system permease protein [Arthrobacter stackebrandtii]|uniref:ABC transport system permease protein n=1 Tax=Arthrobacter stackebrandtii TaxID=272161 RepID=A0ABS4Z185_9MICC|nr:FtsX-like permease family protein [Arthrobacter stackebrandtii]MBP2414806.1 putative ABC transport system permease protein [Arthrobacter stackebrandtii]PYG99465.1 hypothetical protein CVV67_15225 [Arthrobacter stackebrandtii]
MTRLLLADLRTQWRTWLGVLVLAATAGLVLSIGVSVAETGFVLGGEFQEGLAGMAGMILMFSGVSAMGVLGSVAALTVQLQQRSYALWQLLGARSGAVGAIVMAQLLLVALAGSLLGIAAAPPLARSIFSWGFPADSILHGIQVAFGLPTVVGTLFAVCLLVFVGGWRPARRAARTEPLEVLREAEPKGRAMGWLRWVFFALAASGLYGIAAEMFVPDPAPGITPLIAPAMAAVVLFLGPFLYPLVLAAWTALVPGSVSSAWFLARHRLGYSTAAITPLFVGISLTGGLLTAAATQFKGESVAVEQLVIMLGGPILLAAVASAVVVFMGSRTRGQELGLLQASGATHRTLVLAALFEALVYVVTASLLAFVVIVGSGVVIAAGLSVSEPGTAPRFAFGAAAAVAALGGALVLVATLLPTVLGLRKDVISALSAE